MGVTADSVGDARTDGPQRPSILVVGSRDVGKRSLVRRKYAAADTLFLLVRANCTYSLIRIASVSLCNAYVSSKQNGTVLRKVNDGRMMPFALVEYWPEMKRWMTA